MGLVVELAVPVGDLAAAGAAALVVALEEGKVKVSAQEAVSAATDSAAAVEEAAEAAGAA